MKPRFQLADRVNARLGRAWLPAAAACALAGCRGPHSALDPAGAEARHISGLWWFFFLVCAVVFALVLVFLLLPIVRSRRDRSAAGTMPEPDLAGPDSPLNVRIGTFVIAAVVVTVVTLFGLLLVDFSTGRQLRAPPTTDALTIKITGHQWWWQIEYDDPSPANIIQTANELHLPVGRPVQLQLRSADVIHSFWLPNLAGKKDLIPGHVTTLWLQPERTGTFRGQCAEYCGYQHAHMGLLAIVESPEEFAQWQEAQRKPAAAPTTESQRRGQQVFLTSSCVLCHTVAGTPAGSRVGPPLTHFASRRTIGAGAFPNNRGYLAGWILDPQVMKPGVRMPQNVLGADDLHALLDYLESLQ